MVLSFHLGEGLEGLLRLLDSLPPTSCHISQTPPRSLIWYVGLDPLKWLLMWILNEDGVRSQKAWRHFVHSAPRTKAREFAASSSVSLVDSSQPCKCVLTHSMHSTPHTKARAQDDKHMHVGLHFPLNTSNMHLSPCLISAGEPEQPYVTARHSITYTNPMGRVSLPRLHPEDLRRASVISVSSRTNTKVAIRWSL